MKFLVLVKATTDSENGVMPSAELISAMMKYNEELLKAGVLLDLAGLQPTAKAARVRFSGASRSVIDGPFSETKELVAGYWLIQVKDLAEAVEWVKRCPNPMLTDSEIEIRPLFEMADFDDVKPETLEAAARIEAELKKS